MKMRYIDDPRPRYRGRIAFIIINIIISAALLIWSRRIPAFGEWYARRVFPIFPLIFGRLSSVAPFSLFEFITLGVLASLPLIGFGKLIARKKAGSGGRFWDEPGPRKSAGQAILNLCCVVCGLFLAFVLTCGVNYNRETFASQAGLEVRDSSAGELRQLYRLLAAQINELPEDVWSGAGTGAAPGAASYYGGAHGGNDAPDGAAVFTAQSLDRGALNQTAAKTMKELSVSYPGLIDYYPAAKPVFLSDLLSRCQLCGFYSCFTLEANYNRNMPAINAPFTVCHELAHISGFAREDEANFVGYLACSRSDDPYFRYSGVSHALRYALNALYSFVDAEEYRKLSEYLPEQVWRDFEEDKSYWRSFEGRTSEIYHAANDTFLKVNNQEDGMKSYGRMLDLLLAYYRNTGELDRYSAAPEPMLAEISVSVESILSPYAILADRETGAVLFAKDSGVRAEPASVTKILTAVTAIELIDDLDAVVTMRQRDYTDLYRLSASLSGFKVGETVSYRDLLYTLMLISGCDSAYALANNLCGSLPAFAEMMNKKVAELGLSDSHFVDPSGLTAEGHYSTAEDTVVLLDYALKNPVFRQILETRTYWVPPTNLTSEEREVNSSFFSRLERSFDDGHLDNGARLLGGKTGFTNAAGLCLATVGTFDGREYIAVIFGGPGNNRTPQYNFMDAMTLFGAMSK